MKLLEIVPSRYTNPDVYTYMVEFCEDKLGKGIVTAKDTPGFIANRIGVFSLALVINKMMKSISTPDESGPSTNDAWTNSRMRFAKGGL